VKQKELATLRKEAELSASELAEALDTLSGNVGELAVYGGEEIVVCQPSLIDCTPLGGCQGFSCPEGLTCPTMNLGGGSSSS
jgi:hypothetical protein